MKPDFLLLQLAATLPAGAVVTSGDRSYEAARKVWNGIFDRRPLAITYPQTAAEVAAVIRLLAASGLPLAVRCGGHSLPGLSTCDDGVILDLSRMNAITVDPQAQTAVVGGGALLGDLDRAGAPYGLVTPAGVISHTGVGGLTLGGGMGWTGRRFGMTIDSLLSAEVVTASGEIVEASPTSEPELFWGLRGGGGNFGVVSKFTFRMHALGRITAGSWVYPALHSVSVLQRFSSAAAQVPRSVTASFTASAGEVSVTALHSGDDPEAVALIRLFGNLGPEPEGGLLDLPFTEFQSRNDEAMRWGRRIYSRGGFLAGIGRAETEAITRHLQESPSPDCEIYVILLGGAIADVPEDATAYSGRDAGYYWIVSSVWDDPHQDKDCLVWGRAGASIMGSLSLERNYVNEQGDSSNAIARQAYGAEKYARLARLKARFDPQNLFRLNQNIRPEA